MATMHRCCSILLAIAACAACASLDGRAPRDASLDTSADASDAPLVADRPAPPFDGAQCPRGGAALLDTRQFGVVVEAAPHPLSAATIRSGIIDAQGRVYALGYLESPIGSRRAVGAVWRFRPLSLALDETWGDRGVAVEPGPTPASNYWLAGAIDERGRVIVAGAQGDDARASVVAARYTPDGVLDPTFGSGGHTMVSPGRVPGGTDALRPFGIDLDADGIVIAAADSPPWDRPSRRGIALRLGADGGLDEGFGVGGVFADPSLHGCYDVARDGDDYVLACVSDDDRPALLRLDRGGARVGSFGAGGRSVHAMAPRGFQARALERDTAGRWLVGGSVSPFYDDSSATPAAVRFLADGTPDVTYGARGLAVALGVRHSFAFAYARSFHLGCGDRLMFAAEVGSIALVGAFDRDGRRADGFGEDGYLRGPTRASTFVALCALLSSPGSADVTALGGLNVNGVALGRVLQ